MESKSSGRVEIDFDGLGRIPGAQETCCKAVEPVPGRRKSSAALKIEVKRKGALDSAP